jgi:hypothetical protein
MRFSTLCSFQRTFYSCSLFVFSNQRQREMIPGGHLIVKAQKKFFKKLLQCTLLDRLILLGCQLNQPQPLGSKRGKSQYRGTLIRTSADQNRGGTSRLTSFVRAYHYNRITVPLVGVQLYALNDCSALIPSQVREEAIVPIRTDIVTTRTVFPFPSHGNDKPQPLWSGSANDIRLLALNF